MSRSRSPSPYKRNYQRRRSRSISPTVLTKEEQLKKIADLTIINVGRRRDYDDVFGDEKDFWSAIESQKRGDTNFDLEKAKTWWLKTNQLLPKKDTARIYWEISSPVLTPSTKSKSHALTWFAENIWKKKFRTNGTTHYLNAQSPLTSTTSKRLTHHQFRIIT